MAADGGWRKRALIARSESEDDEGLEALPRGASGMRVALLAVLALMFGVLVLLIFAILSLSGAVRL